MAASRGMHQWFVEYGERHRNATTILVYWIGVPAIFFSVIGLLASIPPSELSWIGLVPWAKIAIALMLMGSYLSRSSTHAAGLAVWSYRCLWLAKYLDVHADWSLWTINLIVFIAAWTGQFYGHKVEGKKPSFLRASLGSLQTRSPVSSLPMLRWKMIP